MKYTELLQIILENLLANKEDIKINETSDEFGILLEIEVNKADMPVLIWKKWTTINAIRDIIRVAWWVKSERVNVKIIENN